MTVRLGMMLKFWKIKPISLARNWAFLREEMRSTFLPLSKYSPEVGLSRRPTILRRVVLPQPDGPMIMINSPFLTLRSKLRSANDSASPKP